MQRLVCCVQCSTDFTLGVCERLDGTDFLSAFTRDVFIALSLVSGSSIPPDERCKFGATSWRDELDDGVSNNSDAFRVSVVNIIFMTFLDISTCVEFHRPTNCLLREREEWSVDNQTCVSDQD